MVDGFLAVEKNCPVHTGWELSSTIDATTSKFTTHLRSSNPNLNTPSRIHLIARSAQVPHASGLATYFPFTEFAFSSAVGWRVTEGSRSEHKRGTPDHITFTLTSQERYKEMNPSSSPSFVEVSLAPEAAVPVTPELA